VEISAGNASGLCGRGKFMRFMTILVILLSLIIVGVTGLIIEELSVLPGFIPEIIIIALKLTVIIGVLGLTLFMFTLMQGCGRSSA
jgi:lysylphosphatidylglycerol synthetase-like protein (DUF2156 family)